MSSQLVERFELQTSNVERNLTPYFYLRVVQILVPLSAWLEMWLSNMMCGHSKQLENCIYFAEGWTLLHNRKKSEIQKKDNTDNTVRPWKKHLTCTLPCVYI